MSKSINFTSAILTGFGRTLKGGYANFECALTQGVIKAMGWTDTPDFLRGAKPDGELAGTVLQLTPNDKEMSRHAVEIKCSGVASFEIIRKELEGTKQGKGHRQMLRFEVDLAEPGACGKLEKYMMTLGDAKAEVRVYYEPQATQVDLPGTQSGDKQEPLAGVE